MTSLAIVTGGDAGGMLMGGLDCPLVGGWVGGFRVSHIWLESGNHIG